MGSDELVEWLRCERGRMYRECDSGVPRTYTTWAPDLLGQAVARITELEAQLAEARESERAAVVALKQIADGEPVWLENGSKWASPMPAREAQRIAMEALPTGEQA